VILEDFEMFYGLVEYNLGLPSGWRRGKGEEEKSGGKYVYRKKRKEDRNKAEESASKT